MYDGKNRIDFAIELCSKSNKSFSGSKRSVAQRSRYFNHSFEWALSFSIKYKSHKVSAKLWIAVFLVMHIASLIFFFLVKDVVIPPLWAMARWNFPRIQWGQRRFIHAILVLPWERKRRESVDPTWGGVEQDHASLVKVRKCMSCKDNDRSCLTWQIVRNACQTMSNYRYSYINDKWSGITRQKRACKHETDIVWPI